MQKAVTQSSNIIIDLYRSKMIEDKAIKAFVKEFNETKGARKMLIIIKPEKSLTFLNDGCSIMIQGADLHRSYAGAAPLFYNDIT